MVYPVNKCVRLGFKELTQLIQIKQINSPVKYVMSLNGPLKLCHYWVYWLHCEVCIV